MRMDGRGTGRRNASAVTSAWLYRLGVAACLAACATGGRPALQAQGVPPNRPNALEQLRAAVGIAPAGVPPVGQPPRQGAGPATGPDAGAARHGTPRLDRVARLIDALGELNRATPPPAAPPLLPVAALMPETRGDLAVLEMPRPAAVEDATAVPAAVPPPAPGVAVGPAGSWKAAGVAVGLALMGTLCLLSAFLASRRFGLVVRIRISRGAPVPRA